MILPRAFTVNEANALVPLLAQRMGRVDQLVRDARQLSEGLEASPVGPEGVAVREGAEVHRAIEDLEARIHAEVMAVARLGVSVKGLSPPTVDAPAFRDGARVNLCWALGDDAFGHWHSLERSDDARQPIDDTGAFGDDLPQ